MINWQRLFTVNVFRNKRWIYPLVSVFMAVSLCVTTPTPTKAIDLLPLLLRGVQVFQLSNLSPRQEYQLGQQMNDQVSREVRISRDRELTNYVRAIGERLVRNSNVRDIPYTFQVVEDDSVNAFATTGGFVYMHTGLIKAADNEAELASVIGHEIGHIEGEHLVKQMRQRAIASGVASATGLDRNQAVAIGVDLALNRPRSRQDEFDADRRGLKILGDAGYAQSAMVSFMKKLQSSRSVPTFLSTHPGASDRVRALQQQIENQPSNGEDGLNNSLYKSRVRYLLR
jgi:predicted Zn-dependent protease